MARTSKDKDNKSSKSKIVKTIPNSETGVSVECLNGEYLITQNPLKEQFTLWKCLKDGFEKISVKDNPLEFDKIIPW